MNRWQISRQLKFILQNAVWPGGTEVVFGGVAVSVRPPDEWRKNFRWPLAAIRPMPVSSDPQHNEQPDLLVGQWAVRIYVVQASDEFGEGVLIGGHRASAITSDGRGLLEIERIVYLEIARLHGVDGIEAQVIAASAADAEYDDDIGYIAAGEYILEVTTTTEPFYHPPDRFAATILGGGSVSFVWRTPPDRFDRFRVLMRRAAGSIPPATISSGTSVPLGSNLPTSVTDAPGAGTFSYSLFGTYDEDDTYDGTADSDDQVSSPATLTVVVT